MAGLSASPAPDSGESGHNEKPGKLLTEVKLKGQTPAVPNVYNFFDPNQPIEEYYGCLPHWRQEGAIYFVTFRTADSLPVEKVRLWKRERDEWLRRNPPPHTVGQPKNTSGCFLPECTNGWMPGRAHAFLRNRS